MNTTFRKSFQRDLRRIRDDSVLDSIRQSILDVEAATRWADIPNIKKMKGTDIAFRLRVSHYRIGVFIEDDTVEFSRVLPRSEIYRKFP